jgi:hypothetical protein
MNTKYTQLILPVMLVTFSMMSTDRLDPDKSIPTMPITIWIVSKRERNEKQ